ncbi:MAG: DNA-binding protein WhiA [Clostridia bacterium]
MSFTAEIKEELIAIKMKSDSGKLAMLSGILRSAGALSIHRHSGIGITFSTEFNTVSRMFIDIAASLFKDIHDTLTIREVTTLGKSMVVVSFFGDSGRKLLNAAGFLNDSNEETMEGGTPVSTVNGDVEKRAFLCGTFLGAGYASAPGSAYHLEILCRIENLAKDIILLAHEYSIEMKSIVRRHTTVLYIKEAELISDFLVLIGASDAMLALESARVTKGVRNYANRTTNCDIGNIVRSNTASKEQRDAIEIIMNAPGEFEKLKPTLREMAEIRLNYPEASIAELSEMISISRSGVFYRLKKIIEAAERIKASHGEVI